jgi:uncharacterized membrane protein YbhN (UPF0104 family)
VLYKGGIAMPDVLSVLMVNFVSTLLFFLLVGSAATWLMGGQFSSGAIRHLIQWGFLAFLGGMVFITLSVLRPDLVARPIRRMMHRLEGNPKEWSRIARRSGRLLVESAEHYRESCIRCLREWPLLPVASFLLTAALYLNKFTLAWFVMRGLGVEGSYTTTLAVQALLHFVLYVAPTPGGSGIAELSTGALMAVLLPTHLLGPFTLAYRFFLTYLPAALGAFLLALTVRPRVRSTSVAQKAVVAGLLLALAVPARPNSAIAQNGVTRVPAELASLTSRTYERRSALVRNALMEGIMATCREDSLAAFSLAVHAAQALVLSAPNDAEAHYLSAVALGHRLELSGTREKIRLGAEPRWPWRWIRTTPVRTTFSVGSTQQPCASAPSRASSRGASWVPRPWTVHRGTRRNTTSAVLFPSNHGIRVTPWSSVCSMRTPVGPKKPSRRSQGRSPRRPFRWPTPWWWFGRSVCELVWNVKRALDESLRVETP